MRHLKTLSVLGLSLSTFACGGTPHDSPGSVVYSAPMLLTCADGSTSSVVATGDFNGDKITDLVGCVTSNSASVFLGAGGGMFGNAMAVEIGGSNSLEVHDVDGDGKSDIVGEYESNAYISFAKGNGAFAPPIEQPAYPFGCSAYQYALDGFENAICFSNGTLTISDMAADGSSVQVASMPAPAAPELADLDGDGNLDLVYAIGSSIAVQLGIGGTTFGPVQVIAVLDASIEDFTFTDVDGDGFVDVVARINQDGDDAYQILHNKNGTGFESLGLIARAEDVDYLFQDVTGDGVMDAVLSQDAEIVVMVGKGDGTFADQGIELLGTWTSASGFSFTDLNGDGKPDLVVGGSNVSVLLRQ
jgi:hypothetical protein